MINKKVELPAVKPVKKVAIIGTAPSSCEKAPYEDESWEIWSIGRNAAMVPRYTRWFELHTERVLRSAQAWDGLAPYLAKMGDKLMVGHPNPAFPEAKPFPLAELKAKFGNYFTSSIAFLIALAIHEGATSIGLWGVDMIGDGEYGQQRPCCEYFLGIARGMGIEVVIADESPLLRGERVYAFEYCELSAEILQMEQELDNAIKQHSIACDEAQKKMDFYQGQLTMVKTISRRWG